MTFRCVLADFNNPFIKVVLTVLFPSFRLIGHLTVMDGSEAGGDLVLIQTFLLYYVNQVVLMQTSIFQGQFL